jgi:hypothetical protein
MIIGRLNAMLSRSLYIKLIFLTLTVQIFSLFRKYPLDHPCGRVLELAGNMKVLINCDSAVYMKDAQSPSRIFNGESVYQDRPLPTFIISMFSKLWHFLNLPDYYRNITGNSGNIVTYSLVTYVLFLILNAFLLSVCCWLGIRTFLIIFNKFDLQKKYFPFTALLFILLISMNEITKTFFWTPGSQMFNLLIPVYLFYLAQFTNNNVTTKFFVLNAITFITLMFSYAFSILTAIPLILLKWKNLGSRIIVVASIILIYFTYPSMLRFFGGEYNNFALGQRRMYLWVVDAFNGDQMIQGFSKNLLLFIYSFPIIPTVFIISLIVYLKFTSKNFLMHEYLSFIRPEICILFFYFLCFGLYGYYSRRLTYPIIVFLFFIMLKIFLIRSKIVRSSELLIISLIVILVFYSWVFTNGPLV